MTKAISGSRPWSARYVPCSRPTILEFREFPVRDGHYPNHHEQAGDDESGTVDIEIRHERPEWSAKVDSGCEHAENLDRPDQECCRDRQAGDDDVVVHLAHRS